MRSWISVKDIKKIIGKEEDKVATEDYQPEQ